MRHRPAILAPERPAARPPAPDAARILVVDGDALVRAALADRLRTAGYDVAEAATGRAATAPVAWMPDLVLLELALPDMHGLDVLRRLRHEGLNAPVLIVSRIHDEDEKLAAFEAGADDYVVKPFGLEEVLARIRAALRWSYPAVAAKPPFSVGDLTIDVENRSVRVRGVDASLSPKEFAILSLLVRHAGKVLPQSYLLKEVWNSDTDPQYLRTYIGQIRRKIETTPGGPLYITTVNGVGYRLRVDTDGPDPASST